MTTTKELQKSVSKCWTVQHLEKLFGCTSMTIHNWRRDRGLPAVVIPGDGRPALRFVPIDVIDWAKREQVPMHRTKIET